MGIIAGYSNMILNKIILTFRNTYSCTNGSIYIQGIKWLCVGVSCSDEHIKYDDP